MINAMKVIKDTEYVRRSGTKEELKAAKYIQEQLTKIGIESKIETFKTQGATISKCSLEVTKPYKQKIECGGYHNAPNVKNLKKELFLLKDKDEVAMSKVKDKIVLIPQPGIGVWLFKDLVEAGCAGYITSDSLLFTPDKDILWKEVRKPLQEYGNLPAVHINIKDSMELIQKGASEVCINLEQKEEDCISRNVIAHIKGETDKTIVFTAHYDSTELSCGSWDNMSGSVGILKVAEYFKKHKPHHNLLFIWCGSEERGLLGSKAYCIKHQKELKDIILNINVDMIGSAFASLLACCTTEQKACHYIEYLAKELGTSIHVYQGVYSSDSTPFADNGIPAISFGSHDALQPIHVRYDTSYIMNEKELNNDINFIIEFSKHMANSKVMPIKREIPEKMKEELDIYLTRKKREDKAV